MHQLSGPFGGLPFSILLGLFSASFLLHFAASIDLISGAPDSSTLRIPYKEMLQTALVFEPEGVVDFQPLRLENAGKELIVGARDKVYRLSSASLTEIQAIDLRPSQHTVDLCEMKGQRNEECHNFVRLLQSKGDNLYVCGTNAFHPSCTLRSALDLNVVIQDNFPGVGIAPYSPGYNGTYLMTESGELYTGTVTDFNGHDASILRIMPPNRILRTAKANNRWLNDPSFVASYEIGEFIYFFFRETAVELVGGCNKAVYARVARVCKSDIGGDSLLQDSWTTFAKARLNCSTPGGLAPFYYDTLQSVHYDKQRNTVYGVFTTPDNSILGSAICGFNMSSVQKAFEGPFKYQSNPASLWERHNNRNPRFNCETYGLNSDRTGRTQRPLVDAQKYQLMYDAVEPSFSQPIETAVLETYTHIVVDHISVKQHGLTTVLFVITNGGLLKKFSLLPRRQSEACLVEAVELAEPGIQFAAKDVRISHDLGVLFVGTQTSVLRIPLERCHRHRTKQQCIDAKDPYCGWDSNAKACVKAPGGITSHHFWTQNIDACPRSDLPVNGAFSNWSKWFVCPQDGVNGENCQCRTRECSSPAPSRGGQPCSGPSIQVSNCTRHGNWIAWSEWSECSATCGATASRTRRRSCSDPSPAYGGRPCLGLDLQTESCNLQPCPAPTEPPVLGRWSNWSPWDTCTSPCNGGIQKRTRVCDAPISNNVQGCSGCDTEYRVCNSEPCEEVRRWTNWTPWLQINSSTNAGVFLQRFKFACRARISDPKLLLVSPPRSQEKHCTKDSKDCEDTAFMPMESIWSNWSAWTDCSVHCGNGTQNRFRSCTTASGGGPGTDCPGHAVERRQCNIHSCEATWTCWTPFSPCSVTCGTGVRHRVRQCPQQHGQQTCNGARVETEACDAGSCSLGKDGYGEWSGWSSCSNLGATVRIRPCISASFCKGVPDAQMRRCTDSKGEAEASLSADANSSVTLIAGIVGAFMGGLCLAFGLVFCIARKRSNCLYILIPKPQSNTPRHEPPKAAPTPMVVKQNLYTPPPSLRNIHPLPNLTLNPLSNGVSNGNLHNHCNTLNSRHHSEKDDYATVPEHIETSMTLLRNTMRTSMNPRDYL